MQVLTAKKIISATTVIAAIGIVLAITVQSGRAWESKIFPAPAHLNVDSPEWMGIVETRPFLEDTLPMHVSRPLYPGPAYLVKQYVWPGASALGLLRATNLVWLLLCCAGLWWWTRHWTGNVVAAGLSVVMLVFSPCVQIYASQPVPTLIGNAAALLPLVFVAALCTSRYANRHLAWVAIGMASAVLMLGKEVYAAYLCLGIIAVFRRSGKRLLLFTAGAAMVHVGWILYVRFGIERSYSPYGENQQSFFSWITKDFLAMSILQQLAFCVRLVARVAVRTLQAFEVWPVLLAVGGYLLLPRRPKLELIAYGMAFYAMFFAMNVVTPRICFLMYPAVYPMAALSVVYVFEAARNRSRVAAIAWAVGVTILILAGAIIDPYGWFYYG